MSLCSFNIHQNRSKPLIIATKPLATTPLINNKPQNHPIPPANQDF